MLRTTTNVSAILGGANTLQIYLTMLCTINELAIELPNQLLILKYESYFDKVLNPADCVLY
jgi:methylmalonyl-CoA mutase